MSSRPLPNYLRSHRKAFGLTQIEVGQILGWKDGHNVYLHEHYERIPPLEVVIAYEVLFGTPASELLAGVSDAIRFVLRRRLRKLVLTLSKRKPTPTIAAKLVVLRAALERASRPTLKRNA